MTVVVTTKKGYQKNVATSIRSIGTLRTISKRRFVARLSKDAVAKLVNHPGVAFIREPYPRSTFGKIQGEGAAVMNATSVLVGGYTGENVTVAIIDYYYNVSNPEISDNIVATKNFGSAANPFNRSNTHGTAVAEVIVDTAPNVSLVLLAGSNTPSLTNAIEWVAHNDTIDVVSMSVGPLAGYPLDGSAAISQAIDHVVASGKPFMMSAGNEAHGDHWHGEWNNPDGDQWLNFNGPKERMHLNGTFTTQSGLVSFFFQWNDWPTSRQDYDVYLFNTSNEVVAASQNYQTGSQPPVEYLFYDGPPSDEYYFKVRNASANGTATFNAFAVYGNFRNFTAAQSLVVPATGHKVTAVAAMDAAHRTIEPFSSRGPTVDGRMKPELTAPDNVTTSVYPAFYGTSAAAPHAAAALALVQAARPNLSGTAILSAMKATARPVTGTEPNTISGAGLIDVYATLQRLEPLTLPSREILTLSASYALRTDINSSDAIALSIHEEDIRINGNQYQLHGSGTGTGIEITAPHPVEHVLITNLTVSNFSTGIYVGPNVSAVTIRNSTVTHSETGIRLSGSQDIRITNMTIRDSTRGLVSQGGHNLTITNTTITRTTTGLTFDTTTNATATGITLLDVDTGIMFSGTTTGTAIDGVSVTNVSNATVWASSSNVNRVTNISVGQSGSVSVTGTQFVFSAGTTTSLPTLPANRTVLSPAVNITPITASGWARVTIPYDTSVPVHETTVGLWRQMAGAWDRVNTTSLSDGQPFVSANLTRPGSYVVLGALAGPGAVVGDQQATDPDSDGLYEDLTGDGRVDGRDVLALWNQRDSLSAQYFDFTDDQVVDGRDVLWLWNNRTAL